MDWKAFIEMKKARDEKEGTIKEIIIGIFISLLLMNDWDYTIDALVKFIEKMCWQEQKSIVI